MIKKTFKTSRYKPIHKRFYVSVGFSNPLKNGFYRRQNKFEDFK